MQRKLEVKARQQNDVTEALKSVGDKEGARQSDAAARDIVSVYDRVSGKAGLSADYARTRVGSVSGTPLLEISNGYKPLTGYLDDGTIKEIPKDIKGLVDGVSRKVTRDMPKINDYLYSVGFLHENDGENPATTNLFVDREGYLGLVIGLHENQWHSIADIERLVRKEAKSGGHVYATDASAVIYHEYGHVAVYSLALKRIYRKGETKLFPDKKIAIRNKNY